MAQRLEHGAAIRGRQLDHARQPFGDGREAVDVEQHHAPGPEALRTGDDIVMVKVTRRFGV